MAKKEVLTDLWVYEMLKKANIELHPQGSNIKEIEKALKTGSKSGTGKVGFPEYCGVVKDFRSPWISIPREGAGNETAEVFTSGWRCP